VTSDRLGRPDAQGQCAPCLGQAAVENEYEVHARKEVGEDQLERLGLDRRCDLCRLAASVSGPEFRQGSLTAPIPFVTR
jgi:hypothetical protein